MLEKITFPEHEYESVQNWLNLQGYCYTTRVYKEVGKYKAGESYLAPWGEILRIDEIQTCRKVLDRPFYDEMSDAEKEEICKYSEDIGLPYEFIRFSRISKNSNKMNITIKKTETDDEIKGKAYVHWQSWHEAYPGMVSQDYLDRFTLEKAEKLAFSWGGDHLIIAKAGDRVIGFVGYGNRGEEAPETGEIFALYVLSEYYGTGVGKQLMDAGLEQLKGYPQICLWVLKENKRAIRFYEKCGFQADEQEMFSQTVKATEIRMVLHKQA